MAIDEDPLRHVPVAQNWPAGTSELARSLEEAGVPIGAPRRQARQMLKDAGLAARNDVLGAALRWRRAQAES
jgi:hypothetical protein